MTPARFRKFVLSLEGVEERPHMDRAAFRTARKIFATLGDDARVNLKVEPIERREALMTSFPESFVSLGGWTRLGYVGVVLATVDQELFRELVLDAWNDAKPKAKAARAKKARTTGRT